MYIHFFSRRVVEVAATVPNVTVFLDDVEIEVKNFHQYVELFLPDKNFVYYEQCSESGGERYDFLFLKSGFCKKSFIMNTPLVSGASVFFNFWVDLLLHPPKSDK